MRLLNSTLLWIILVSFFALISCTRTNQASDNHKTEVATKTTDTDSVVRKKVLLFFGNSLTAGAGLEIQQAFPNLIQLKLDSLGYDYEVVNAGVSGETTAMGSNRIDWVAKRQHIDIFVLELGANDGLRGLPVAETRKNLGIIIDKVRGYHPNVTILLAGMMVPPSMGKEYSDSFYKVFTDVASLKQVTLIPFLLENVAGIDTLNLPDGIHPNVSGQKIVKENVWKTLEGFLKK